MCVIWRLLFMQWPATIRWLHLPGVTADDIPFRAFALGSTSWVRPLVSTRLSPVCLLSEMTLVISAHPSNPSFCLCAQSAARLRLSATPFEFANVRRLLPTAALMLTISCYCFIFYRQFVTTFDIAWRSDLTIHTYPRRVRNRPHLLST